MVGFLKLFQLLSLLSSAYSLTQCAKYTCKTSDQDFLPETCAYQDNITDTYYARKCSDSSYDCVSDASSSYQFNYTCKVPTPLAVNSLPGEWCKTLSDCLYSTACEDGICIGTPKGEPCTYNGQCEPGTFCSSNNVCTAQIEIGKKGCLYDFQCVNNGACNITSQANPSMNTCYKFRSFSVHDPVGHCNTGFSTLCPYIYCAEKETNMFYCTDLLSTANGTGTQCDMNSRGDCDSNEDSFFSPAYSVEGDCTCGLNSQGTSYCSALPGDIPYKKYTAQLSKWVTSEAIFLCNTLNRFDDNCIKTHWDKNNYNNYVYYEMQMKGYQWYINAQDCVMETFGKNYLQAQSAATGGGGDGDGGNDSAVSFVSFSMLTLALIAQ